VYMGMEIFTSFLYRLKASPTADGRRSSSGVRRLVLERDGLATSKY
jgi:hypothetical protein